MFSHFHIYQNVTNKRTDRQTDKHYCCINIARRCADARSGAITSSSAVAERPRDASCLSVVSFNIPTAQFFYYQLLGLQIY